MSKKTVKCVVCREMFNEQELIESGAQACPKCNSKSLPMDIKDQVSVNINWHELRVLSMWAEQHARKLGKESMDVVVAITTHLEKQQPLRTPLMFSREVNQLEQKIKEQMPGASVEILDGNGGKLKL